MGAIRHMPYNKTGGRGAMMSMLILTFQPPLICRTRAETREYEQSKLLSARQIAGLDNFQHESLYRALPLFLRVPSQGSAQRLEHCAQAHGLLGVLGHYL